MTAIRLPSSGCSSPSLGDRRLPRLARGGDQVTAPSTEDALRYVLANVDDGREALERANSALATATAYGRIAVARNHDTDGR